MARAFVLKHTVDLLLAAGLAAVFAYQWTGNTGHERAGTAWILLVLFHNALNRGWYKTLFRSAYSPRRAWGLVINLLLLADVIVLAVSGVCLSRDLFAFLGLPGGVEWRRWHVTAAYWAVTLAGLHAGMHMAPLAVRLRMRLGAGGLYALAGVVGALGVWGLIAFKWWPRLWGISPFMGWDGSLLKFVILLFLAFGLFCGAGYLITGGRK